MILDTGYRCHELTHMGLLPFAAEEDYHALYNQSGYSGPIKDIQEVNIAISGFSGILGPGTPYPTSGTIDQITRMFWGVKSWNLSVSLQRNMDLGQVFCNPVWQFHYCDIGGYRGVNGLIEAPILFTSKTLTMQDYCSNTSNNFNIDKKFRCPYSEYSGTNPNTQICSAVNPIQKFDDLVCRKTYASWTPTNQDWNNFTTGVTIVDLAKLKKNPYISQGTQFRVFSSPDISFSCPDVPFFQDVYSMFALSIMDPHSFVNSGSCLAFTTGYTPETYDDQYPFDCLGRSGETLASSHGDITGYGINPKPSGINIPLLYDIGTGISDEMKPRKNSDQNFFPLINFNFALRTFSTAVGSNNICPVRDRVSSLRQRLGQKRVGRLIIRDFISGANATDLDLNIMTIPLFATSTTSPTQFFVEAVLQPQDLWVNSQLQPRY